MFTRLDLIELEGELEELNIDMSEELKDADRVLTLLTSSKLSSSQKETCNKLIKAEGIVLDLMQKIIAKTNPDMNIIIEKDDAKKERYGYLVRAILLIRTDLTELKNSTVNKILTAKQTKDSPSNEIKIGAYVSHIHGLLNNLFYVPLKEAIIQYNISTEPIIVTYEEDGEKLKKEIPKNNLLYWFNVYSYFLNSSQTIGTVVLTQKDMVLPQQNLDVHSLGKALGRSIDNSIRGATRPEESEGNEGKEEEKKTFEEFFSEPESLSDDEGEEDDLV